MDFPLEYLDAVLSGEAWRLVAQQLAAIRGLSQEETYVLYSEALRTVHSIPGVDLLRNNPMVSDVEIIELLRRLPQ